MSKSVKNEWFEWFKAIIISLVVAYLIQTFIFATSVVQGKSMDPTLENGERVLFNKLVYLIDEPKRGDIVIIQRTTKNYVKRIIGLPNETIEVKDHVLYINGSSVEIKFSKDYLDSTTDFGPITIPPGKYFVMGDNRSISKDSRNGLGLIAEDEIVGRSEYVIFPFTELGRTK